jgi:hypothetical protein
VRLFDRVIGPPNSDSNCLSLAVTIPWPTALHIAVFTTPPLLLSVCKYNLTFESSSSPSKVFLPRFLLSSSTILIFSAVSKSSLRLRVFISFLYESRNKRTVDSFKPENYVVNLRVADAGPFSAAYCPILARSFDE